MKHIQEALKIAVSQLWSSTDKAGKPLILHALNVMMKMDTEEEMITAVLHDVPEESGNPVNSILVWVYGEYWFDIPSAKRVEDALKRLTHQKGVTYADYIDRISFSPLATKVKIADLLDNLDSKRLALLDSDLQEFLMKRYRNALIKLGVSVLA